MTTTKYPPYVPGLSRWLTHQGKIRDTYRTTIPGALLFVATDRVSTHNVVHLSEVTWKGYVLTALTIFWLIEVMHRFPNHLIAYGRDIYDFLPQGIDYPDDLHLRGIIVKELKTIPIEFIRRERMAGSLWKDYYSKGLPNPYGLNLPEGLQLMSPFEDIIFTPTDKSETDDPLNSRAVELAYREPVRLSREAYEMGWNYALDRGIDIIDTKFEIGIDLYGNVCLADEILTPDSSRFVPTADIKIGQEPPWADKQILREEAERMWKLLGASGKSKPPLTFSEEILGATAVAYQSILGKLTCTSIEKFQDRHMR